MVRLAFAAFPALAVALALTAWVPASHAGTPEAPEITDPAGDQLILDTVPGCAPAAGCQAATRIDVLAVWIDEETATQFNVNIELSNVPTGATTATSRYRFHATFGGAEVVSEAVAVGGPTPSDAAPASNVAAAAIDGNTLILTIDKSVYGAPAAGGALTGLFVEGHSLVPELGEEYASDRAPDDGAGTDYTFTGGGAGGGSPGDSDGDGLNDTEETRQFGGTAAQNGTGDPDGDGLNNTAEFDGGTNATNEDTDGDGLDDKQDPFPLDPLKPGASGNGTGNATADSDGDGLPDAWERSNFNSTSEQSGSGDPDSDGLDNADEFAAGTDPNDADTDGDGLNDSTDPKPLAAEAEGEDRLEMYAGAPMFAAIATLCLFALARK